MNIEKLQQNIIENGFVAALEAMTEGEMRQFVMFLDLQLFACTEVTTNTIKVLIQSNFDSYGEESGEFIDEIVSFCRNLPTKED